MLKRVIGASGSGKTEYIFTHLGEALSQGKRCFLIVPEQQSVAYESAICDRFGDSVNLLCEVLNFERLPNRVAREFGGLAVNNIDKGGACALLSLVAESLKDRLTEYMTVAGDPDFATSLFSLISRMKMALISPALLKDALENNEFEDEPRLSSKLRDILLIYSEYEKNFGDGLCDPRDALTRLAAELPNKPFFKDSCVFIDNYYTFTEQEYSIIKEIIAQSSNTYISFTVDNDRSFFDENAKSAERVRKLANGASEDVFMPAPDRAKTETLAFLERNIWKNNVPPFEENDGSLRLVAAKNRFDEVEAAAAQVLEFVRSGGRYRDVTILSGNPDKYSAIIDSVFSRAEIPIYMSSKEDLVSKPLFSFLLSSLAVVNEDFSLRSMKHYVKSGYADVNVSESDALLNYASRWNLRGKAWYGDSEWTLDPEGYREGDLSPHGAKTLALANRAREKVVSPLAALRDTLSQKGLTVSKGVRALYSHLISMEADEKLRKNAEKLLKKGERENSEREIQLWKLLVNILDQLDSLCGEREITSKRLFALIKLMCSCYSLGAIPASADSITFGDASLIRAADSKLVIVLGVCDGEFPASSVNSNFFDRNEAVFLEGIGLKLADTVEKQLNTNRFFVYSAFAAPTERLVLLYPRSEISGEELRPSSAWITVDDLFKNVNPQEFSADLFFYSRESIASNFPMLADGDLKNAIESALVNKNSTFFREHPSVVDRTSKIGFDAENLLLSPSRFERYVLCPFSFFGQYLLDLKEKKKNDFSMSEIGNFAHKILEQFMRECVSTGSFKRPDETERRELVEKLTRRYFLDVIGNDAENDKRFMHSYKNMVKTVDYVTANLCEEFSESKFVPTGFEFKIGLKEADVPAIEYDVEGKKVYLRGSIDRVDTYESGGVTYVRVVDYKTYKKPFSASLVAHGLDTQLLHYLFAYCDKKGAKPAGVFYYTVQLPDVQLNGNETQSEIESLVAESIGTSGLLLDDSDIVFAMSPSSKFVPVGRNNDGSLKRTKKNLLTSEGFDSLAQDLKNQVETIASEVFCGNMDISPNENFMNDRKHHPCKYCSLGNLCRSKRDKEDEDEIHSDSE